MDRLDLSNTGPGGVRVGTVRVLEVAPAGERDGQDRVVLAVESAGGELHVHAPARLVEFAKVEVGDLAVVCARLEHEGNDSGTVQLEMVRRMEPQPGASIAGLGEPILNQGVVLDLTGDFASYLLWLICRDLSRWTSTRRSRLTHEEVRGLALYLHDSLPLERRTPLPPVPSQRAKRTRAA